jgi:hypothetical protein
MRKHFTARQPKCIILICLFISLLTNLPDLIQGFKNGIASVFIDLK